MGLACRSQHLWQQLLAWTSTAMPSLTPQSQVHASQRLLLVSFYTLCKPTVECLCRHGMLPPVEDAAAASCVHHIIPSLAAAVAANPAAAADHAIAALQSSPAGAGLHAAAWMRALTPGLAQASYETTAAFSERMCSQLQPLFTGCSGSSESTASAGTAAGRHGQALPGVMQRVRQLAAAAALTRDAAAVNALVSVCQACWDAAQQLPSPSGAPPALESVLGLEEQAALVHHLLLCPAAAAASGGSGGLWRALHPLCRAYCVESAHPNAEVHGRLLPQWLPAQVRPLHASFTVGCCQAACARGAQVIILPGCKCRWQ